MKTLSSTERLLLQLKDKQARTEKLNVTFQNAANSKYSDVTNAKNYLVFL